MANGFYGSLSKIQKINFQFDRIFPNRAAMDQEATLDFDTNDENAGPVLNGRYVLVDYHEGEVGTNIIVGYDVDGEIMAAPGIPFGSADGAIALSEGDIVTVIGRYINDEYSFYDSPKKYEFNHNNFTEHIPNENSEDLSVYEKNLLIDSRIYENFGRGYDSTVWQKTYKGGKSCYVMIAELNALSPTLALAVDAPTLIPDNPYFGTDSTLNFYRLHTQPNWGLRVKRATPLTTSRFINGVKQDITYSSDVQKYPSDAIGDYVTTEGISNSSPLAIYFNKKGLNKFVSASNALNLLDEEEKTALNESQKAKNFISVTPTGRSGKIYRNIADGTTTVAPDTYELSIMLPSIGETVSKIWDLVYGENRYYNADGLRLYYKDPDILTDQTANAFASEEESRGFRNIDTYWNSTQGLRAYKKENGRKVFDRDALKTMAGIINSAHDLMGMIVRTYDSLENVKNWDPTKIYFINGKHYIKNKQYEWTAYDENELVSNQNAYQQLHTLPTDIDSNWSESNLYIIDEEPGENGQYTKQFLVQRRNEGNVYSYLYRKVAEEYPEIPDEEVYDEEYESVFKTGYNNYIKVKDASDIIEGAIYGFITDAPEWTEGQSQDQKQAGHTYYYYDTSKQYGVNTVCYIKDDDNLSAKKGIYYDLTDIANHNVDKSFYIPDVYYVKDNTSGLTRLATENTLNDIIGSSSWSYTSNGRYVFYKKAEPTEGTIGAYVTVPSRQDKKRMEVPADRYTYGNNTLIIYKDSSKAEVVEVITKGKYYGQSLIEFSDLQETVPIYYYATQYLCEEGGYYTLDEIFTNGLTKADPEEFKPYRYWNPTGGTAEVLAGIESTRFDALQDFYDGQYFYFYGGDAILVLETLERLKTSQGRERSENLRYYQIADFNNRKKFFFSIGGSYYLTAEGDYKYYPALHLTDPNEFNLTNDGKPLNGETRILNVSFQEIPLDQCRWFKPDVYYTSITGQQKVASYTDNGTYYERIGNIIGNSEPVWPDGMEWNEETIPNNGILGYRELTWTAKEIKGLGEDFNTMYGLILKTYQLLQNEDKNSRDSYTIQGVMNQCKDVLKKLENRGYSYHSIEIENKNGSIDTLNAQNAAAAIKLKSNTHTIELSTDNDNISLDLSEQYRKWVVPSGDTNGSNLIFKDNNGNQNVFINVANNKAITVSQSEDNIAWETVYNDAYAVDDINFSSLIIRFNPRTNLFSVTATEQNNSSQHYDFTIVANATAGQSITRPIVENYIPGSGEQTGDPFNGSFPAAFNFAFYCTSTQSGASSNLIIDGWTKSNTPIPTGTIFTIDANKVLNIAELPTYNNKPLSYSETSDAISFGWDNTNQIFTIYSNGDPILQIRKQED